MPFFALSRLSHHTNSSTNGRSASSLIPTSSSMSSYKKNYYLILAVSRNASIEEIKRAYKRLALKWHPDKSNHPNARQIFNCIHEAYEILSDPMTRSQYDSERYETNHHQSNLQLLQHNNLNHYVYICAYFMAITAIPDFMLIPYIHGPIELPSNLPNHASRVEIDREGITFPARNEMPDIIPLELPSIDLSDYSIPHYSIDIPHYSIDIPHYSIDISNYSIDMPRITESFDSFVDVPRSIIQLPPNSPNQELLEDANFDITTIPNEFICPLSGQIFSDPVHNEAKGLPTVERCWIEKCLSENNAINPFNRAPLELDDLIPHTELKEKVEDFMKRALRSAHTPSF